jgi:hypothetical protein
MFYNLQQLVQLAKEDLALRELPPALSDAELLKRVKMSALKDISLIYPRIEEFNIGVADQVNPKELYSNRFQGVQYWVPKWILHQFEVLSVISVDNITPTGYADVMNPVALDFAPDDVMASVAGIQAAASVGRNIANAISYNYDTMRHIITIYNGWSSGSYRVRITVAHDENLSSIPSTAMMFVRDIITYDIGQFIYNTMKRKNKIDSPAGTIELNIDDLADCGNKKRDLIEKLLEDAELDFAEIEYF